MGGRRAGWAGSLLQLLGLCVASSSPSSSFSSAAVSPRAAVQHRHSLRHGQFLHEQPSTTKEGGVALTVKLKHATPRSRSGPQVLLQLGAETRTNATRTVWASSDSKSTASAAALGKEWYGTVWVGTPAQEFTVALDTGAGNLVLPDASCQSIPCSVHRAFSAALSTSARNIAYISDDGKDARGQEDVPKTGSSREQVTMAVGRGRTHGNIVEDTVCLGKVEDGVCAKTKFISATQMDDAPFGLIPYDGILGLGLPETSVTLDFNLLGNLAEKGVFSNDRFAVWLAEAEDGEDSEVTFGAFRPERLASELVWLNVERGTGLWVVQLEDFAINDARLDLCAQGCFAALDTGTSVIGGPTPQIDALVDELRVSEDCANYAKLPKIGFIVEHYILNLEPKDYIVRTDKGCFHLFKGIDIPPPKGPLILLGDPFLRRYYTVFDRSSLKVGISMSQHKSNGDTAGGGPMLLADKLVVHQ